MQLRKAGLVAGGIVVSLLTLRSVRRRRAARKQAAEPDVKTELEETRKHVAEAVAHARAAGEHAVADVREKRSA